MAAEELEALADAAWLLCHLAESMATRRASYTRHLEAGAALGAGRVAWRLFWDHLYQGETTVALGWLRRARRHLAAVPEAAEHGFVALADAELALNRGSLEEAAARALDAVDVADRHGAQGIVALG